MRELKKYGQPFIIMITKGSELMTIGGSHIPGPNNGGAGDVKGNGFSFDREDEGRAKKIFQSPDDNSNVK
ncbi:MAG: hypothetical protein LKG25_05310 [Prevotella sp.]|jgi:hypothetical protein|nr:hypothetical protein [Prevotella sp.]MCI1281994.1 hypothetical protein [Prevotella sp.]